MPLPPDTICVRQACEKTFAGLFRKVSDFGIYLRGMHLNDAKSAFGRVDRQPRSLGEGNIEARCVSLDMQDGRLTVFADTGDHQS